MKNSIVLLLVALCSFSVFAEEDATQDAGNAWSVSLSQTFADKYVWRGIQFNGEGVSQTEVSIGYDAGDAGAFGLTVWGNLDLDSENSTAGQFSELDYVLSWEKTYDNITASAGFIFYDFSEVGGGDTQEFYVGVTLDTVAFTPSLTVYYDIEDADGFYVEASASHSFALGENHSLDLGATLGWADEDQGANYYGGANSGVAHYSLSASVDFPVGESLTITPSIMYYSLLSDANDLTGQAGEDDDFVFGINASFTF
jgi:hypothetical protein